jgi:hypothetical protein
LGQNGVILAVQSLAGIGHIQLAETGLKIALISSNPELLTSHNSTSKSGHNSNTVLTHPDSQKTAFKTRKSSF